MKLAPLFTASLVLSIVLPGAIDAAKKPSKGSRSYCRSKKTKPNKLKVGKEYLDTKRCILYTCVREGKADATLKEKRLTRPCEPTTTTQSPNPPTVILIPEPITTTQSPHSPTVILTPEPTTTTQSPNPPTVILIPEPTTTTQSPNPPTVILIPEPITTTQSPHSPTVILTPEQTTTTAAEAETATPAPPTGNEKDFCRDSNGVKYKIGTGPEPENCLQKICRKKTEFVSEVSDDCAPCVNDGKSKWNYGNTKGPSKWATLFPKFCAGRSQSPINIVSCTVLLTNPGPIAFSGYHIEREAEIVNNGHSVSLSFNDLKMPTISGGRLPAGDTFEFLSVHWHWGSDSTRGSEHTLDGRQFPMEMHVIHWNTKYQDFSKALSETDGLAVLGFFYEISEEDNLHLQPIVDKLRQIEYAQRVNAESGIRSFTDKKSMHYYGGSKRSAEEHGSDSTTELDDFSLDQLLPPEEMRKEYFYYSGSLTTPTCNEVVLWTIFKKHLYISESQLDVFRSLMSGHTPLSNNYRPTQPLNGRVVETTSNEQ